VYGRLAEKRRGHIADGLKSLDFALATIGYTHSLLIRTGGERWGQPRQSQERTGFMKW